MLIKRVLQLWEKITITNEAFIDGGVNIMWLEKAWNCDGLTKPGLRIGQSPRRWQTDLFCTGGTGEW